MPFWKLFAIVVPIFFAIDMLWLGVVMKDFYSRELGEIARRQGSSLAPRWGAVVLVYILIPAGLRLFARPSPETESLWSAIGRAALFGFVMYGVYDLTNLATLERWSVRLAAADMAWGTTLGGLFGAIMYWLDKR